MDDIFLKREQSKNAISQVASKYKNGEPTIELQGNLLLIYKRNGEIP